MGENECGIDGTVCMCVYKHIRLHTHTHTHNLISKNCFLPIQYVQVLFHCVNKQYFPKLHELASLCFGDTVFCELGPIFMLRPI